ncbi:MAG: hypothetical protein AAB473_05180 [Patescibacteria group bacterium]
MRFRATAVRELSEMFRFNSPAFGNLGPQDRVLFMDLYTEGSDFACAGMVLFTRGDRRGALLLADRWSDGRILITTWIDASFFYTLTDPRVRSLGADAVAQYCTIVNPHKLNAEEIFSHVMRTMLERPAKNMGS